MKQKLNWKASKVNYFIENYKFKYIFAFKIVEIFQILSKIKKTQSCFVEYFLHFQILSLISLLAEVLPGKIIAKFLQRIEGAEVTKNTILGRF